MCGIAGFYNADIPRADIIRAMTDRMRHRGPDAEGFWLDSQSGWTFGHRRLSILDLSESGAQPMVSASGRTVITYNGEIYNASLLREKLVKGGYIQSFRGHSDTEILLEAIEAFGLEETLKLSKGMFALAVYDRREQVLRMARDRAGEKPLYYGFIDGPGGEPFFAFASDCALFRCIPGFRQEIDRDALAAFLLYKFVPAPMSIYKRIYKLPAGKILTLRAPFREPEITDYWSMVQTARYGEAHPFTGSYEEAKTQLEALLTDSIREQMVADVPVGAFLSGGIDSPLVVSLMQKLSSKPVKTFTIGYDDPRINEAQFAKEIAQHLGTDHSELFLTEKEMKELIPTLPYYFSEPLSDSSLISTYFVSKLARQKVTVSLSGDAGDELFCGYERYWDTGELWKKVRNVPYALRSPCGALLDILGLTKHPFFFKGGACLKAQNVNQIREMIQYRRDIETNYLVKGGSISPLNKADTKLKNIYAAMQLADMEYYFPDDILYKVDRASMAHSLESRVPMLDRDYVEFAWTLPQDFKYKDHVSKRILRDLLYQYVPKAMLDRPKQGFYVPIQKWLMEGSTFEYTNELLEHSHLARDGYLDGQVVKDVWAFFQKNRKKHQLVFNLLMAEQWYRSQQSPA
ncbi:MAG: asparagine synthase (glutamine-hydrolyzing) [Clostridia bacterium]|nr:asparagine synthase (glutamine-hydrolyzing) [Clostridia bacterium]